MNNWLYNGKQVTSMDDMPDDVFGFVYEVTHKPSGKKYLGKKQLIYSVKRKIGKRETKRLKEEAKEAGESGWWNVPKHKYVERESDWLEYLGSNVDIQKLRNADGVESFERKILEYGYDKKHLTYLESKYLFTEEVLEKDEYLNNNILGKFYGKDTTVDNDV